MATWLGLPLIVGEAGTDPGSYRNHVFDSFSYGLGEIRQFMELLRDTRPAALIYWQFTEDYGLVRVRPDKSIEETGRYNLFRQLANLSLAHSQVLASSSDQEQVLVTAFAKEGGTVIQILNSGQARTLRLSGLGAARASLIRTEEESWMHDAGDIMTDAPLALPARSLSSLVLKP